MSQTEKNRTPGSSELATFGGGCFWCMEAIFERLRGVVSVESGYAGGDVENPTYKEVTSGATGHAEVVQITFHPTLIGYNDLLKVFFETHDPTTRNRQGADVGTQYRSLVLYHNDDQRQQAEDVVRKLDQAGIWSAPIVTTIEPFRLFFVAEESHQEYFDNNPDQGYCQVVIRPKVEKFEKVFKDFLK
ncbi:MAG: peptide-methionine (S)-S-oxide reductase MsrA [Bacteroidota bacterium]